jgi:CRISPR-associated protein Csm3
MDNDTKNQFKATVTIHGKIECVTGLHIGGSGGGFEIGGMDNPVIRTRDGYPYIPGSSLKGKMRSLMEWAEGKVRPDGKIYFSSEVDDPVSRIFGAPAEADRKAGPTRIIVRDALPDDDTREMLRKLEEEQGLPKVEVKTEVNINRITSKPLSGPRQLERVPAGSFFELGILYAIYDVEEAKVRDADLLGLVFTALRLVEDSFLGGSGSRGSGQVRFHLGQPLVTTLDDYKTGTKRSKPSDEKLHLLTHFTDPVIDELRRQLR